MKLAPVVAFLIGAVAVAGIGWFSPPQHLLDRWTASWCDCPGPLKVSKITLNEQKRQQKLIVSSITFDASASTEEPLFIARPDNLPDMLWRLISTQKTISVPVTVDYFVDLSIMSDADLRWDEQSATLTVERPAVSLRAPQVLGSQARVEVANGFVLWVTGAEEKLTEAALTGLTANAESAARRPKPMENANTAADRQLAQTFLTPLRAAGIADAKVVVRVRESG